jgi:acetyl esterase
MNFMDQLDPELRVVLEAFPAEGAVNLNDIPAARAKLRKLLTAMQATLPAVEGATSQDQSVPGPQGDPAVPVRIYQPNDRPSILPAFLWIHGGMFFGTMEM